jgi:MoaA/NifB/PqqE/SkfB family radical SAM enzyme
MKIPHEKFCVLPWVSLETSPIGTVRPCCLAEEEITDINGNKFDLSKSAELADIQDSNYMRGLRKKFLRAEQPETCRKCWNEEAAGRTSKRMHTLNRLEHMIPDTEWTQDAKPLMFLDLKLGNICNLKCRICGSWSSSTFAVEELQEEMKVIKDKKDSFHYMMIKKGAWAKDNDYFWDEINNMSNQIRYIEFTGGEPFMIKEHFQLLERIVDLGIAGQVEIHYNTNGTQFPAEAENIWQHFKTVEIAFSIDDVEGRFEYQRSNAIWAQVEHNIARFDAMRMRNPNIKLQACITVNVFNVLYLAGVAKWVDQQGFDFIYWNMLHDAWFLSIANLPQAAKDLAREKLTADNIPATHRVEMNRIVEFMMAGTSTDGLVLLDKIFELDSRRGQTLRTFHYELAEVLGYVGPRI